MKYQNIGNAEVSASVIGLNGAFLKNFFGNNTDSKEILRVIHAGNDYGINLVIMTPSSESEKTLKVIGEAIADRRKRMYLTVSCNPCKNIESELNLYLTKLGTDYIDLFQITYSDDSDTFTDNISTLIKLKESGRIKSIGLVDAVTNPINYCGVIDSNCIRFSLLEREAENNYTVDYCYEKDISIITYSEKISSYFNMINENESNGVNMQTIANHDYEYQLFTSKIFNELEIIAEIYNLNVEQLLMAWTIHRPGISNVLCCANSVDGIKKNAEAGDVILQPGHIRKINLIYSRHFEAVEDFN